MVSESALVSDVVVVEAHPTLAVQFPEPEFELVQGLVWVGPEPFSGRSDSAPEFASDVAVPGSPRQPG